MDTAIKLPMTVQERFELGPELIRFSGTEKEFWALLEVVPYNLEFQPYEIIAMSYETDLHSRISSNLIRILGNIFEADNNIVVHDMNRPIYIPATGAIYNPDGSVVRNPGEKYSYLPGMNAELEPILLVEVHSKTTREHDLAEKLSGYKTIPGIEQIIYVESALPQVTVFTKDQESNLWKNTVYDSLGSSFEIAGTPVTLHEIYRKVQFEK